MINFLPENAFFHEEAQGYIEQEGFLARVSNFTDEDSIDTFGNSIKIVTMQNKTPTVYDGQCSKYSSKGNIWSEYNIRFTKYGAANDIAFAIVTNVNTLNPFLIFAKTIRLMVSIIKVPIATHGKTS